MNSAHPELHCLIITLDTQADNSQKLKKNLNDQGLSCDFFPAVDGRHGLPQLNSGERLLPHLTLIRSRKSLSNTEVACYLSHYRAVKNAYNQGAEYVCVMEDDIILEDNFGSTIQELMKENLEMVRLMALKIRRRKEIKKLTSAVTLTRPERGTLGAQAYLMNRSGMNKLLKYAANIYEPIDVVFDHFYLFDLKSYLIEPHVAHELVHPTTVIKTPSPDARPPNFFHVLAFHPVKLIFSLRRHWYLLLRRELFYPAQFPSQRPGRSPRLRAKGTATKLLE